MIEVTKELVVRSERVAGSWTLYRVWVEKDGEAVPWSTETADPHACEEETAAKLRKICGLQNGHSEAAGTLMVFVIQGFTSPFVWGALIGWLFLHLH